MRPSVHYSARSMSESAYSNATRASRTGSSLLAGLALRVRRARKARGWSRQELARRSGLSIRFLARVEAGDGNISVLRLEALARALDTSADRLVRAREPAAGIVTLVGLRGAGKSTVGPLLARRLGKPFLEMDARILEIAGLALDQLFELHDERYYRQLEKRIVREIVTANRPAVVAAAGGVVNEPSTWRLLRERTTCVWLRARAEEHWSRVISQGDRRPMNDNPSAMEQLRSILGAREATYSEARLTIDTSDRTPEAIVEQIANSLDEEFEELV